MPFYSGKNGITKALQQHDGALEFLKVDEVRINGVRRHVYEVRRYSTAGWEFVARVEVKKGSELMNFTFR